MIVVWLQLRLPDRYGLHPRWHVPGLELVLLVILRVLNPVRLNRSSRPGRVASIGVVAAITVENAFSAGALDYSILKGYTGRDALGLLARGAAILRYERHRVRDLALGA